MCISPIKIYNKATKLSLRGAALYRTVPCGKCVECRQAKQQEYFLRAHVQHKYTLSKGGFSYWDTLTYDNKTIPTTLGIKHFCKKDVVIFTKKLRVYLERSGYEVEGNLDFMVCSEYGGKTHRPHYHIIFFVRIPNIDVLTLWDFVNRAWTKGLIDERRTAPSRVLNSDAAIEYVTKYVTKDDEFLDVIERKLYRLKRMGADQTLLDKLDDMNPFHKQSTGLGSMICEFYDYNTIKASGRVTIPDPKFIKKDLPLGTYLEHKLFYEYHNENGKVRWILTEDGIEYKVNQLDFRIENYESNSLTAVNNLSAYNIGETFDIDTVKNLIDSYLDGRTLKDYATYVVVYKDHLLSTKCKVIPDYKDFYRWSLDEGSFDSKLYDENLATRSSARSNLQKHVINQYRFEEFRNFDNLYNLFSAITSFVRASKDKRAKQIDETKSRLKLILGI